MPVAPLMVIGYGLPATVALAGAPALLIVALVTVSLPTRPLAVDSVPANATVAPYIFERLFAVTVRAPPRIVKVLESELPVWFASPV